MERVLEPIGAHHQALLAAVALRKVDVSPAVEGCQRYVAHGETKHGFGPCGLVDIVSTDHVIEPHITWFPWTSARQRIGHFKWAMETMSQTHQVLLQVEKKEAPFFDHFARSGLLRKIGYISDLPIVKEIHMYQYNKEIADE